MRDTFDELSALGRDPGVVTPPLEELRRRSERRRRRRRALAALASGLAVVLAVGSGLSGALLLRADRDGSNRQTITAGEPGAAEPSWTLDLAASQLIPPQDRHVYVDEDLVLIPSGFAAPGQVSAYGIADGVLRWTYQTGDTAFVQAVQAGIAIVSPQRGQVVAIDVATGQATWRLSLDGDESPAKATIQGDTVDLATSVRFEGATDPVAVFALDRDGGEARWRTTLDTSSVLQWSAPVVAEGLVFVLEAPSGQDGTTSGRAVALDATTGRVRWSADLGSTDSGLHHQPALYADGVLLAPTGAGAVVAIEVATGQELWTHQGDGSVPALATGGGGVVYIGVTGQVSARDVHTGDTQWEVPIPATEREPWIAVHDQDVIAATDHGLAAFAGDTGTPLWTADAGALVGPPAVAGDEVYAATPHEAVAVDARSGEVTWRIASPEGALFVETPAPGRSTVMVATDQGRLAGYRR